MTVFIVLYSVSILTILEIRTHDLAWDDTKKTLTKCLRYVIVPGLLFTFVV